MHVLMTDQLQHQSGSGVAAVQLLQAIQRMMRCHVNAGGKESQRQPTTLLATPWRVQKLEMGQPIDQCQPWWKRPQLMYSP